MQEYIDALRAYMRKDYKEMYREKGGIFQYGFSVVILSVTVLCTNIIRPMTESLL